MPSDSPNLSPWALDSWWLSAGPSDRVLLVVGAHPDDETVGLAGTIARYSAHGVAVHYVCATRGECGSVPSELLDGYPDIVSLRLAELRCAADALGLAAIHFLGYRDSGMPDSPDNMHPSALIQAPLSRVTGQIVALIRTLRPQVVVTFGPYGGYGHPDHIHIHKATCLAFSSAGIATEYPEHLAKGLRLWQPHKLYYSTFGTRVVKVVIKLLRIFGKDPRRFGANGDVDLVRVAAETTPITASLDVRAYTRSADRARHCHRSQLGDLAWIMRLPVRLRQVFVGTEHFTRVIPAPSAAEKKESDLFAGLG